MNLQVEKLEKNTAKLTIEVPAEQFDKAIMNAYNKNKAKFNIPGFRKGKAPFHMIKKMYGVGVFFEDAANEVMEATYPDAAKESGLEIVSRPTVDVEQIEEGKNFIYTALVAVKPEVTLGEYKGVEVHKVKAEVTDADVEAELNSVREKNSRLITVEDRAVENGDIVKIDFDGFVDGERFDGGKSEGFQLTIGSHTFIDTFEEQLIGKNIGEEVDVNVTFPAEYHVADLQNKPALFKVVIHEIQVKELPELDDEFASEVSDFDTMEEYKKDVAEKLLAEKQSFAATQNENNVVDKVVANATMEIPEMMLAEEADMMVRDYARRMQSQGFSIEQYMQITGMTTEKLAEEFKPQAEKRIQTRLVLEAVVKAENIVASDETVEAEFKKMAEAYKMEVEQIKGLFDEDQLAQMKEDLAVQEAIDFLVAEAKLVD
ncbi:MAG: trigger factor [Lachnospiraceae bacterium]|nr:trigger factor [Lachnospiraceae bacterium]